MADATPPPSDPAEPTRKPRGFARVLRWPGGLSARLLLFTLLITIVGLCAIPPTLAAFERQWLLDRVRAAELASTIAEADPDRKVTDRIAAQLLDGAGVA